MLEWNENIFNEMLLVYHVFKARWFDIPAFQLGV